MNNNFKIINSELELLKMFKKTNFLMRGTFDIECRDKYGNLKWREVIKNKVVYEGLNSILNIMFHNSTQISTWYVAIFENDHTPASTDTYAEPGYTECSTGYDETQRPEYVEAAASGQSITNSANKAVFTMNCVKTIYGASLVGGVGTTNKGGTTEAGTLFCSSKFASGKPVVDDDVLNITYTINDSST